MNMPLSNTKIPVISIVFILSIFLSNSSRNAWSANLEAAGSKTSTQTFVTYKYIDPMTRMEVFRMLIPKGWKAEGDVKWLENQSTHRR